MGRLYSITEVASLCDVGRDTIEKEIRAGYIRAVRVRGSIRIPESEVRRIYAEGTRPLKDELLRLEPQNVRPF